MIDIKVVSGNPNERDRESRAFHFSGSYSYLEIPNERRAYKASMMSTKLLPNIFDLRWTKKLKMITISSIFGTIM